MKLFRTFLTEDVSQRLSKHDLLLSSPLGEKKKKKDKVGMNFQLETRSLSVLLPVYRQEQEDGEVRLRVTELRLDISELSASFLPSSKQECLTAGGLQEIRASSFPWAPGDSREVSSLQALQSTVDATRIEMASVSLSCAEEEEAYARELLSIQEGRIILLRNRRWNVDSELRPDERRVHVEVRRSAQAELRSEDLLLVLSLWDNFRNNPVARAMREEEEEVKQMLQALQAAHLGATSYNNSRKGMQLLQEPKKRKVALLSARVNGLALAVLCSSGEEFRVSSGFVDAIVESASSSSSSSSSAATGDDATDIHDCALRHSRAHVAAHRPWQSAVGPCGPGQAEAGERARSRSHLPWS